MNNLINCRGRLIDLSSPRVMGILNLTPDSFYDGGKHNALDAAKKKAGKMLDEGATFIDVGAYSSRPNAEHISVDEELMRLAPVVESLVKAFPEIIISVDTFRAKVAEEAVNYGAAMINDISAGRLDPEMFGTVARLQVPYCMMHMRGTSSTMNTLTDYADLISAIIDYFSERIQQLRQLGLNDIIIDPGFGFAKNMAQNYELLDKLENFKLMGFPLLAGLSRKSMLYKKLGGEAGDMLNATTAVNTIALVKGVSILRVHDVKEAVECVKIFSSLH